MKACFLFQIALTTLLLQVSSAKAQDSLFSENLFNDGKGRPFADFDLPEAAVSKAQASSESNKKLKQEMLEHGNDEMRRQMMKVAQWLQEFSLRNQYRFPGTYGSSGSIERAASVQLTELVGKSNPYSALSAVELNAGELSGLSPGLSFFGSGSPIASDEYSAEIAAGNSGRIILAMDGSAGENSVNTYRKEAPGSWQAAPGSICAEGNGSGYFYVWGAGADGKPLKDLNGQTYIIAKNVSALVNEQGQESAQ